MRAVVSVPVESKREEPPLWLEYRELVQWNRDHGIRRRGRRLSRTAILRYVGRKGCGNDTSGSTAAIFMQHIQIYIINNKFQGLGNENEILEALFVM